MHNVLRSYAGLLAVMGVVGCQDLSNPKLPDGTQSPTTYLSREGGVRLAEAALRQFRTAWVEVTLTSGLLTDELSNSRSTANVFDQRSLPEAQRGAASEGALLYSYLHELRGQSRLARAVLADYASDLSPALRARLYAFEGYAEVWLADLFCSGVPLSTIDFKGDYTYRPSSTTADVYSHAITLFDSALTLGADSAAIQTLASIGKARALVASGKYAEAEAAVANVQATDAYQLRITFRPPVLGVSPNNVFASVATVSDLEGGSGLPYRTSGDKRTAAPLTALPISSGTLTRSVYFPTKYPTPNDSMWIPVASGVEAELVRAEGALQRNEWSAWISQLNTLRTTGTFSRTDTVYSDPSRTTIVRIDTAWQAGTGGVAGLRPLTDPGTEQDRIALQFAERAAWLFVSGQRQGDLRRLVRAYGWSRENAYPSGSYTGPSSTGLYGSDITIAIPTSERPNPLFRGCLNRD